VPTKGMRTIKLPSVTFPRAWDLSEPGSQRCRATASKGRSGILSRLYTGCHPAIWRMQHSLAAQRRSLSGSSDPDGCDPR
jgi:hypothetical protein